MATESRSRTSLDTVKQHAPEAGEAFAAMRKALGSVAGLSPATQELIVSATFVVAGEEGGFRTHARRALQHGASVDELRQAVLLTLGATATLSQVSNALRWVESLAAG